MRWIPAPCPRRGSSSCMTTLRRPWNTYLRKYLTYSYVDLVDRRIVRTREHDLAGGSPGLGAETLAGLGALWAVKIPFFAFEEISRWAQLLKTHSRRIIDSRSRTFALLGSVRGKACFIRDFVPGGDCPLQRTRTRAWADHYEYCK